MCIDQKDFNMKATAFIGVIAYNEGIAYYETHEKSVD